MFELYFPRPLACMLVACLLVPMGHAAPPLAPVNAALHDTAWTIHTLDGQPVTPKEGATRPWLELQAKSQHLSGFGGCGRIGGRYMQRGTQIALSVLTHDPVACSPDQMAQESRLIELLRVIDAYRIEGAVLSLMQKEVVRVTLEAPQRH